MSFFDRGNIHSYENIALTSRVKYKEDGWPEYILLPPTGGDIRLCLISEDKVLSSVRIRVEESKKLTQLLKLINLVELDQRDLFTTTGYGTTIEITSSTSTSGSTSTGSTATTGSTTGGYGTTTGVVTTTGSTSTTGGVEPQPPAAANVAFGCSAPEYVPPGTFSLNIQTIYGVDDSQFTLTGYSCTPEEGNAKRDTIYNIAANITFTGAAAVNQVQQVQQEMTNDPTGFANRVATSTGLSNPAATTTFVECLVDADCSDSSACTTDVCDAANTCHHTTISCDDHDACTTDSCDTSLGCINAVIPGCIRYPKVLAVHTMKNPLVWSNFVSIVNSSGQMSVIHGFNGTITAPNYKQLAFYDVIIIVATNNDWVDRDTTGNAVARFIEAGKGVVDTMNEVGANYHLGGDFDTYYRVIVPLGSRITNAHLGNYTASHPIMYGIDVDNFLPANQTGRPTSQVEAGEVVAYWDDGTYLAVVNDTVGPRSARRVDLGKNSNSVVFLIVKVFSLLTRLTGLYMVSLKTLLLKSSLQTLLSMPLNLPILPLLASLLSTVLHTLSLSATEETRETMSSTN